MGGDSLQEFVTGLSVLARGTVQEKLLWAFSLYDTDGDGVVTREDLLDVVSAIYDLMGSYAEPAITPDTARQHVDTVFQAAIYLFICLFIYQPTSKNTVYKITQFKTDKTNVNVWIEWPTQGRATYVQPGTLLSTQT